MKKIIRISTGLLLGLVLLVLGVILAFNSGVKSGYLKGFNEGVVSVPAPSKVLPGAASWAANITASKVVRDASAEITLVLQGTLFSISASDKSIVIKAKDGEDSLTVYFRDNAVMPTSGVTTQPKLDMARLAEFINKDVTVVAMLAQGSQKLEGTTFFSGNQSVKLH